MSQYLHILRLFIFIWRAWHGPLFCCLFCSLKIKSILLVYDNNYAVLREGGRLNSHTKHFTLSNSVKQNERMPSCTKSQWLQPFKIILLSIILLIYLLVELARCNQQQQNIWATQGTRRHSRSVWYLCHPWNSNSNNTLFNFRNSLSDCSLCTVKCTQNNRSMSPSLPLFVFFLLWLNFWFVFTIILNHKTTYVHCCHNKTWNFEQRERFNYLKGIRLIWNWKMCLFVLKMATTTRQKKGDSKWSQVWLLDFILEFKNAWKYVELSFQINCSQIKSFQFSNLQNPYASMIHVRWETKIFNVDGWSSSWYTNNNTLDRLFDLKVVWVSKHIHTHTHAEFALWKEGSKCIKSSLGYSIPVGKFYMYT